MLKAASTVSSGLTLINSSSAQSKISLQRRLQKTTKASRATNTIIEQIATKASPTAPVWGAVLRVHLSKLRSEDKALCDPLPLDTSLNEESLQQVFVPLQAKYQKGLFHRFVQRVAPIAGHILSFGKAIDVAVGGGPVAAGVIWGGIRILLTVSIRTMALHEMVVDRLESLTNYLPLFDRWTKLFPTSEYTELAKSIKNTCSAFFSFIVESILYFRRPAFFNALKACFSPGLERRFVECEKKIKRQTEQLSLQVNAAGLESAQRQGQSIVHILEDTGPKINAAAVVFPFRFVQNCPRNNQFFGRENSIKELDELFDASAARSPPRMGTAVIHGLGGCGKTSVAKEYMYRHFDTGRYPVILWLYASNQMKLESQFIVLTRQLGIKTNESDARDAVLHWINHLDRPFLIIFDNADDPSFLPSFWPSSIRGSVLITSRNLNARDVNLAKDGIHLKAFSDDAGSEFLCSMLDEGQTKSDTDKEAIQSLARYFGGLPLALRQAGTFMTRKSISPSQFKHLYQQRFEEIEMLEVADYEKTVADTWAISSSTLTEDARILLDTLSLLDPDSIPTELFDVTELAHPHAEFLSDPLRVLDAREDLTSQSLVDHDSHSNCFSIHRLFQEITFRKLKKDVKRLRHTLHFAATLIHKFSPEIDLMMIRSPHLWKPVEKTLSHIHSLHERCKNAVTEPEAALLLRIMTKVLNYAFESAQYTLGDQAFDNAQELLQKISDPDHEVLALLYFIHGRLCCETSQPQQAVSDLTYSCKHIEIAAKAKPELLNTTLYIRILSNLGIVYTAVNQFKKAEKFHKQAIQCCRDLKMEKECSMGNILQNLAGTYLWSGDLPKAKETLDEAQRAPNTAVEAAEYTLGNWMLMSERYDEAAILHKGALEKYAKQLGSKHPVVADSWHKMGTLFALPEYSGHDDHEAERCFRQNLSIWTTLDASRNPMSALFLARGQWGLGSFLAKLGPSHQDEAQKMKQEALDFLHRRFEGNLPGDKDPGEVLEDLVFYWSR